MKFTKMLMISILVHIFLLLGVYFFMDKIDVLLSLLFVYVPILISVLLNYIYHVYDYKNNRSDIAKFRVFLFSIPNIIYILCSNFLIFKNIDNLLDNSIKYKSQFIDVAKNESPVMTIIIVIIVSIVLHYASIKFIKVKSIKGSKI